MKRQICMFKKVVASRVQLQVLSGLHSEIYHHGMICACDWYRFPGFFKYLNCPPPSLSLSLSRSPVIFDELCDCHLHCLQPLFPHVLPSFLSVPFFTIKSHCWTLFGSAIIHRSNPVAEATRGAFQSNHVHPCSQRQYLLDSVQIQLGVAKS
jgi:hypothetical protein